MDSDVCFTKLEEWLAAKPTTRMIVLCAAPTPPEGSDAPMTPPGFLVKAYDRTPQGKRYYVGVWVSVSLLHDLPVEYGDEIVRMIELSVDKMLDEQAAKDGQKGGD